MLEHFLLRPSAATLKVCKTRPPLSICILLSTSRSIYASLKIVGNKKDVMLSSTTCSYFPHSSMVEITTTSADSPGPARSANLLHPILLDAYGKTRFCALLALILLRPNRLLAQMHTVLRLRIRSGATGLEQTYPNNTRVIGRHGREQRFCLQIPRKSLRVCIPRRLHELSAFPPSALRAPSSAVLVDAWMSLRGDLMGMSGRT